jgi:hypothetical protein
VLNNLAGAQQPRSRSTTPLALNNLARAQQPGWRSITWLTLNYPQAAAAAEAIGTVAQREATPARQGKRRNPAEESHWAVERARRRLATHIVAAAARDRP